MADIYLATSGEYSDYGVVAAFDNEEAAKLFTSSGLADDYHELPLLSTAPRAVHRRFLTYTYDLNTGELLCDGPGYGQFYAEPAAPPMNVLAARKRTRLYVGSGWYWRDEPTLAIQVNSAEDGDKAQKAAYDAVAKWKAEQAGL